jgi:diguanylate cyclase (GGDEF)-like protein
MSTPAPTEALPRLLVAEDSQTSAALIARYLDGRYDVVPARDGEAAWSALLADPTIELVVTDLQMPRLTGHGLLGRIRASEAPALRNLAVIVMTAADDSSERNLAFENGASDFVHKPVDPVELRARIAVHLKLSRTIRELDAARRLFQEQATTDPLTRLRNRRAFFDLGAGHLALARRHGGDLSVVMLDIDHFKRVNDTHGHHVGDEALVEVARTLAGSMRVEDVSARVGGEEFAILLPNTGRPGAATLAERLRAAVEQRRIPVGEQVLSITVSAGVASYGEDGPGDLEQLLDVADRRLYLAKQGGRNRVVAGDEGAAP